MISSPVNAEHWTLPSEVDISNHFAASTKLLGRLDDAKLSY
jgi:hypothetical protein